MAREVVITEAVRRKARAEGDTCARWLASLGTLITELEHDWAVTVGATYGGGTAAFVADAVTEAGTPAVIKLAMPAVHDGRIALEHELRTLLLADGRGCVRVFEHDMDRGAILLERLGRQLIELDLTVSAQMQIICSELVKVWAIPIDRAALPALDEKGRWLAHYITNAWEALSRPCSARAVERAVVYAERRVASFDRERAVLAHGDAHAWNTLEDPDVAGGFRLIDPDGLIAEPAYDLAIIMREFTDELRAGDALALGLERARFLARHTGFDEAAIWEWGYVERVANALLTLEVGDDAAAADMLHVVERWSAAP